MTNHTTTRHPLTTGNLPPKGRKLIIRGAHLGGSFTPANDDHPTGGVFATYRGLTNGHATFEGRTSDRAFVGKSASITWELA